MSHEQLHEKAIQCVRNFKKAESELISILQEIDNKKSFRFLGYASLFQYATVALKLAENQAYTLITVARKAKEIPELKEAISAGVLNSSNARRITSLITPENKDEWIKKAAQLSQRELEKEVAALAPKESVQEKMNYVTSSRVKLQCGITEQVMKQIERAQDLLSQKTKKPCSLEDCLAQLVAFYLETNDPLKKAERALKKSLASRREHMATHQGRPAIPAKLKHEIHLRDHTQCTAKTPDGKRCGETRWIEIHHRVPLANGGQNTMDNLVTLCANHHKRQHELNL